jgi:hypothetical protein
MVPPAPPPPLGPEAAPEPGSSLALARVSRLPVRGVVVVIVISTGTDPPTMPGLAALPGPSCLPARPELNGIVQGSSPFPKSARKTFNLHLTPDPRPPPFPPPAETAAAGLPVGARDQRSHANRVLLPRLREPLHDRVTLP